MAIRGPTASPWGPLASLPPAPRPARTRTACQTAAKRQLQARGAAGSLRKPRSRKHGCHATPRPLKMGAGGFARVPTPPELFTGLPATLPPKWVSAPAPGPLTAGSTPKWEPVTDRLPLAAGLLDSSVGAALGRAFADGPQMANRCPPPLA